MASPLFPPALGEQLPHRRGCSNIPPPTWKLFELVFCGRFPARPGCGRSRCDLPYRPRLLRLISRQLLRLPPRKDFLRPRREWGGPRPAPLLGRRTTPRATEELFVSRRRATEQVEHRPTAQRIAPPAPTSATMIVPRLLLPPDRADCSLRRTGPPCPPVEETSSDPGYSYVQVQELCRNPQNKERRPP